ncbi:glycosyltransferase [Amantichitinum ursilacus]|uniref:D-inositol 3-phosphate glycosyltransferase n=1 Tax=Amantichitinum ursilacus TaxID=857265 RepID=A0A0N0GMV5_9NEIS|nr:glycosyltransferase [Amantichitinum ursilacus]KPC51827.1 D-inositol 3-phosphate glycosyltransferase [Amantichitinum ursilacus]
MSNVELPVSGAAGLAQAVPESRAEAPAHKLALEVVCFTGNSGLTDYSVSLCREIAKRSPVALYTAQSINPQFGKMGFRVEQVFRRTRQYFADVPKYLSGVTKRRPDVVLFQAPLKYPALEGLAVAALRSAGIRVALTVHDVLPHYPKPWSKSLYSWFYRQFDGLIVHSEAARKAVLAMGVQRPMLCVPHGVYDLFNQTNPSKAAARAAIGGIAPTDKVVLFFGHLEPRKGLLEFIKTAQLMAQTRPDVKFMLAGGSDMSKHGAAAAAAFEAARHMPNVLMHDRRIPFEEVENYFAASDVVALPYLEGTTSGVLKLALAFGIPVIATRVGDFAEEIPAGAGELFEASNIAERSRVAIETVLANHAQYAAQMATAADRCAWSRIADQYLTFLGSLPR